MFQTLVYALIVYVLVSTIGLLLKRPLTKFAEYIIGLSEGKKKLLISLEVVILVTVLVLLAQ